MSGTKKKSIKIHFETSSHADAFLDGAIWAAKMMASGDFDAAVLLDTMNRYRGSRVAKRVMPGIIDKMINDSKKL